MTGIAGVARELHEHGADAARRAEHDDRLAGAHARAAVQHAPRRHAVDDDRLRRGGVHAVRDRDEVARVEHHAVGPAADLGQRRDARARGDARVAAGALHDPTRSYPGTNGNGGWS